VREDICAPPSSARDLLMPPKLPVILETEWEVAAGNLHQQLGFVRPVRPKMEWALVGGNLHQPLECSRRPARPKTEWALAAASLHQREGFARHRYLACKKKIDLSQGNGWEKQQEPQQKQTKPRRTTPQQFSEKAWMPPFCEIWGQERPVPDAPKIRNRETLIENHCSAL
jgi:hypothetical protein